MRTSIFENVVSALDRKMTIFYSNSVSHEIAYKPFWADHLKNLELIHTWSKKYNFIYPHYLSHLSFCEKNLKKNQPWHVSNLEILTMMG